MRPAKWIGWHSSTVKPHDTDYLPDSDASDTEQLETYSVCEEDPNRRQCLLLDRNLHILQKQHNNLSVKNTTADCKAMAAQLQARHDVCIAYVQQCVRPVVPGFLERVAGMSSQQDRRLLENAVRQHTYSHSHLMEKLIQQLNSTI
tara:strand:- start:30 stop:467 length:438 start_codon:yes stop_codon:yes gene_type:complete